MEKYFTFPKVMSILWEFMIGVVCTEIFCPGWPGQDIKRIDDMQTKYNENI